MRVLLINPPVSPEGIDLHVPLGILCIAAALEKAGHSVEICDFEYLLRRGEVLTDSLFYEAAFRFFDPTKFDVIGFTAMGNNFHCALELARLSKKASPGTRIIFGGPQADAVHADALKHFPFIDVIVRGEGEETVVEVLKAFNDRISLKAVSGISFRDDHEIVSNEKRPLMDAEKSPYPAYHLIDTKFYLDHGYPLLPIYCVGGCPYVCNFCSTSRFFDRKYRLKSTDRLIAEMKWLDEKYDCKRFDLIHDNFTYKKDIIKDFCSKLIAMGSPYKWRCTSRPDGMTDELFEIMAEAGCENIFYGVESGNQERQTIIRKKVKVDQILPVLERGHNVGIPQTTSYIVGFENETKEELNETLTLALKGRVRAHATVQLPVLRLHNDTELFEKFESTMKLSPFASRDPSAFRSLAKPHIINEKTKLLFPYFISFREEESDLWYDMCHIAFEYLISAYPLPLKRFLDEGRLSPLEFYDLLSRHLKPELFSSQNYIESFFHVSDCFKMVLENRLSNDPILRNAYAYERCLQQIHNSAREVNEGALVKNVGIVELDFDFSELKKFIAYEGHEPEFHPTKILIRVTPRENYHEIFELDDEYYESLQVLKISPEGENKIPEHIRENLVAQGVIAENRRTL